LITACSERLLSQFAVVLDEFPQLAEPPKALTHGEFEDLSPVFSPDGKSIAVVSNRKRPEESGIWIVPPDGSAARPLAKFETPGIESPLVWSADGRKIFFHRNSPRESTDLLVADVSANSAPV
jgi:Tol biopolymer transport system component